ncbi:hypothetical protein K438DRAFT_1972098 [Mycena galopus ATCC 62051]|nr:hypothetical protein K438DRAFT_1972098 [Mycena galopus ATCC 62051]
MPRSPFISSPISYLFSVKITANRPLFYLLRIREGEHLHISIVPQRDERDDIWGRDAAEHILTFRAGPRSSIGLKFALVYMKPLIFTLIRTLKCELAVPIAEIRQTGTAIVSRSIVLTHHAAGSQLPLLVRALP